jgi:integrase
MSRLNELITFEYESAYAFAYDLTKKQLFSTPKIYSAKGNLNKRWYVYFSFREPTTGKLKRITPIYGIANKYKTKEERMSVLVVYQKALLELLQQGYNPYDDNIEVHQKITSKEKGLKTTETPAIKKEAEETSMLLKEAFDFGLKLKEKLLAPTTKRGYENKIKNFLIWMKKEHPEVNYIHQLNKKLAQEFLNNVLEKTSPRNRNNFRTDLSSIIQTLEDNDIIEHNFIKKIKVLKAIPERNKTYSQKTKGEIFEYLEEKDPILLLFIKFISYNFLRPIEVCRLKVRDIDIENRTIQFKAKNSPLKTKIIPEILWDELPDLLALKKDAILFTPEEIGGKWETEVTNRRDYFSKRFKKVVKDHFGLGKDYGLYSFRHTYITKLYRAIRVKSSPHEAKSKLMQITGHSSMAALEKYLRDIDAEQPEDYSEMLKENNG